ncbi:SDR family NAD(P)-dependent oxidoreductase [Mesorhizobium sp. GbtcB19]|uniref:SDR family NAD(P)-dependent oxidoreductase n=1 Tax=Mesorhizobium sp. GbtcB19 TaxID=2824764 RepID=UPI001C2F761B|nr:SDR family oxidoreductase [Mesorhizobium sp. GbtcB19]
MSALLIVGCASGIGKAIALHLAKRFDVLVLADIDAEGAGKVGAEIAAASPTCRCEAMHVDIRCADSVAGLFAELDARGIDLAAAANNAGVLGQRSTLADSDPVQWRDTLELNVVGTYLLVKHEIAAMRKNGGGRILNTASEFGARGAVNVSAYVASKHAVIGMTRAAALEVAQSGILINAICPGAINAGITKKFVDEVDGFLERTTREIPMRRLGHADEVASAAAWLLGPDNSYMTGQSIFIDGGNTA